jgi:ATP synthase F1 subcomplex alpha subunit
MKQVAGKMRLEMAQFRELAAFAQFASDLDKTTRDQIERGLRLTEILKQPHYSPLPVEKQIAIIFAVTNGFIDKVAPSRVGAFEKEFHLFLDSRHGALLQTIREEKALSDATVANLKAALTEFTASFNG